MNLKNKKTDHSYKFKCVPNLEERLNLLNEEQLLELGFIVLEETLLVLKGMSILKIEGWEIWMHTFMCSTHHLPRYLRKQDFIHLKYDISRIITDLYNLSYDENNIRFFQYPMEKINKILITDC